MSDQQRSLTTEGSQASAAPYPPMYGYPSAQIRSSTTSPNYSSSLGGPGVTVGGAPAAPSSKLSGAADAESNMKLRPMAGGIGAGTTSSSSSTNFASTKSSSYTPQVQFCHTDLIACINCATSTHRYDPTTHMTHNNAAVSTPTRTNNRKQGPVLLDIRRLVYKDKPSSWFGNDPTANDVVTSFHQQVDQNNQNAGIFETQSVALSHGNPSLGSSATSTCLDVSTILVSSNSHTSNSSHRPSPCATGLTTGALCIHTFSEIPHWEGNVDDEATRENFSTSIEYFHIPRNHRQASAVAWRKQNSRHVAVGLTLGGASAPGVTGTRRGVGPVVNSGGRGSADREFCCFLWDIEHQSAGSTTTSGSTGTTSMAKRNTAPLFKLCHNAGVYSLAWLLEGGQTLAVGGQRTVQIYDLRISGKNNTTPPISAFAHYGSVTGIEVDSFRPNQFATFSRVPGEPVVKIWDARRMDSVVSEIKLSGSSTTASESTIQHEQQASAARVSNAANSSAPVVSAVKWSSREAGTLSIANGDTVHDYETLSGSRPVLSRISSRAKCQILNMALYPRGLSGGGGRVLAVLSDRSVQDLPQHTNSPLAISRRDGRVVHALGQHMWIGSTRDGKKCHQFVYCFLKQPLTKVTPVEFFLELRLDSFL